LAKNLIEKFDFPEDIRDWTARDNEISQKIKQHPNTDLAIQKFTSAITAACDTTFQVTKPGNQAAKKYRVPWWTKDLTLLRKNACFEAQVSTDKEDDNLRLERKQLYQECNRIYQTKLREEKLEGRLF